jgi:hypothetical protein
MSWLFSQALVEEYSVVNSWDGAPSAPLSMMPTPHRLRPTHCGVLATQLCLISRKTDLDLVDRSKLSWPSRAYLSQQSL